MPETLFTDPVTPPPDSSLMLAPGENVPNVGFGADTSMVPNPAGTTTLSSPSGLGLAPAASAAPATDLRSKLQNMPALGKALVALGAGADAALGRKPVIFQAMEADRKDRLEKAVEFKAHLSALEDFSNVSQRLTGQAKTDFDADASKQLDQLSPGLGDTYKHIAEQPALITQFQQYMPYLPEPLKLMMQRDPAGTLKFMGTAEGAKQVKDARDQYLLKIGTQKATSTIANAQQLEQFGVPKETIDVFLKSPTASNFLKLNQALPDNNPLKLSPDQLQAATANGETFYSALGVLSPKSEQAVAVEKEKVKALNPEGVAPKSRTIQRGGQSVSQQFVNGAWQDVSSGPKFNPAIKPPSGYRFNQDGDLEPISGGPKDAAANPQRDKMQADALAMYRAQYPMGKLKATDPTADEFVADYIKKKGTSAPATATGAPQTAEAYRTQFGKPAPSVGNKAGFDKLKPGDGYIDSRDGKYKIKG